MMTFGGFNASTLIDYPGRTACMVYTIGCNFRCPYCHNPELVDEVVDTTYEESTVIRFLQCRIGLLDGVVITGGEPTMHGDDLLVFMEKVKSLGYLIKLDTNGTNPAVVKRAIDNKLVDYIAMDIKAPLSRYHETVGRPVNISHIRETINLLRNSSLEYEFRTTVVKALLSREDIASIVKEIEGARAYYLQRFIPTHILNPQFRHKVTYSDEELEELQKMANQSVMMCGIR